MPLNPSSATFDEITASGSEPAEEQIPVALCGDKISIVSLMATRFPSCLLWRRDFILSILQVGKLAPPSVLWRRDFIVSGSFSLVATRFHLVGILFPCGDEISSCRFCKLKTCSHMGELAATWETVHPQKPLNAALFRTHSCLATARSARPHRQCYPQILRRSLTMGLCSNLAPR